MTPINSMRLLVVSGSAPEESLLLPVAGCLRMKAQPPGPGLPLQAPSVNNCTNLAGPPASFPIAHYLF